MLAARDWIEFQIDLYVNEIVPCFLVKLRMNHSETHWEMEQVS